jgi:4-diphosphocytidyl-2-C-methyl-D-erythritol kinase
LTGAVLEALCPAKVNLALRVLDRRADGYHELDTVFQAIDLWDRLELRPRPGPELSMTCDDPAVPTDERNLVLKTAERVRTVVGGKLPGASFNLRKAIPAQGGLGGGSSDAAGALLLCVRYWGREMAADRLQEIGASLGADVPFFLTGGTARGRGRGDRIEPLPFIGPVGILLGLPPFGISTQEVFEGVRSQLTLPGNGVSLPLFCERKWPGNNDFSFVVNDLERVVFGRWPDLRRFRDHLLAEGAGAAVMSGSGSTVYGIFREAQDLDQVAGRLKVRFPDWRLLPTRAIEDLAHVA